MASDDEQNTEQLARTLSDTAIGRQHLKTSPSSASTALQTPESATDLLSGSGDGGSSAASQGVAGKINKKDGGWGRKSARGLFFRSGSAFNKAQDGESPPVVARRSPAPPAGGAKVGVVTPTPGKPQRAAKADTSGDEMRSASTSSREDTANGRPPTGKSWTGNFMRSNSFLRSNSLPVAGGGTGGGGVEARQWWENDTTVPPVVEEEMEPEPYPPNLEKGVKVRKRSMAGKTEIRRLFVRGDTIELVNPEKRMFRSQSKIFPLSDLTAVVAQGERSLSLSLGSKGLHLTLADRATKEFLWEHLRKMREHAREQAKASRITRAASIDAIDTAQDVRSKKKSLFKRSQSYNDAAAAQLDSGELDDDTDFLDDLPSGDGRVVGVRGVGQSSLAAKGRKFLKRISRGGNTVGGREDGDDDGDDGDDEDFDQGASGGGAAGRRDRGGGGGGSANDGTDEWSDSESLDDEDSEDDGESSEEGEGDDRDDEDEGGNVSPESTARSTGAVRPSSAPAPYRAPGSSPSGSSSPETEVAVVESSARRASDSDVAGRGEETVGTGLASVLRSSAAMGMPPKAGAAGQGAPSRSVVTLTEPIKVGFENGGGGMSGWQAGKEGDGGGYGEGRMLKKAATLPTMPRVSLLAPSNRPKGSRKCVQFQVPENEGLDSDTSDSPLPEFLSNPDIRFEVMPADRAALCKVLEQLRGALKRATSSENCFTASRSTLGLMPNAGSSSTALSGMRMSRVGGSSSSANTGTGGGAPSSALVAADGGMGAGAVDQGRLGKQYGSGLPSLLACLKGLRRAGSALCDRHFFCYTGGFTELISTAEKAWVAISKRNPPDVAAIDRVKAAVIEARQLAEDHGGGPTDIPHAGARLVVRMVRGLLERDGERLKELSRRIATAARAAIVVGDVFEDEAAGELQLRYMACLDGAPLDKAARTHEKLRTLGELMSPFASAVTDDSMLVPIGIEDMSALLWRAHDMLYARPDANAGRRGVFKSSAAPLLPPRRDVAPPPVLCTELPPHHVPRLAMQERVASALLARVSPWDPPMVITGAPGAGKTILSSAVARRSDVRRHFRDGIFWLPAGKDATERLPWLLEYLAVQLVLSCGSGEGKSSRMGALGGRGKQDDEVEVELPWGMRGPREGEVAGFLAAHLATRGLTCLLVVDDLWDRESLDQVRDLGFHVMVTANSKGQLWTQHGAGLAATLGSEVVAVDRMDDEECKLLLNKCSSIDQAEWTALRDSEPVRAIIKLCRHGPHALVMIGSTLQGQSRHFSWGATRDSLAKTVELTRSSLQNGGAQDPDYVALYSAAKVCIHKLPDHIRNRYLHLAILPRHVPAPEQMLESLWDTESDDVFDEVLEKLRGQGLLQPVTIMGDQGRSGHVTSNAQMDFILNTAAGETVEHAAARMSLYLGRLKVLKSGLGRKAGGKYLAMGRCGLVSCWAEVEKRFGFTALEAYTDSIRAYREKAIALGQGSSLKLAAAVKLLADYLFLTEEKVSALEYYKEALARVEARTEHDRAKPQTQSFSAQVLKGIARCMVAEGQLEEAEQRFQKAMGMENARNPGASRAMLEYCQILRQMGHFDRASAVGGQALALVQTGPTGPHSAESAVCVASLASLAAQQGKVALSEELYRRSLAVALRVFGARHPAVAAETNVLAVFLVEHGRNSEAEACYRQSMEIWERTLGPYSPELASGLNNLAILLFMEDRPGEAAATFQRSLDIRQRVLPPKSLETAQGLNNLALLYTSQGQDPGAAERLHREALSIREARLGRNHPEVAQTCHNLALLLLKSGPAAEQSPTSARATGESYDDKWQWERVRGPASGRPVGGAAGNGMSNGAGNGSFRWRHTEAVQLLERALAVHRETLGDEHPVTEESLQALAAAGGSLSPPPTVPRPMSVEVVDGDSRPTSTDPPPPSLECLDRTSSDGSQERLQERQRQQQQQQQQLQREQEQRVKWEQAQVQKLAREHALQQQQIEEEKQQKQQRELLRQQHLEQQALTREAEEIKARDIQRGEERREALLAQQQQRQLQHEQRARQLAAREGSGSNDEIGPRSGERESASGSNATMHRARSVELLGQATARAAGGVAPRPGVASAESCVVS